MATWPPFGDSLFDKPRYHSVAAYTLLPPSSATCTQLGSLSQQREFTMRQRVAIVLSCTLALVAVSGASAYAKRKAVEQNKLFQKQLVEEQKILQALNRLTFGPRP